FLHQRRWSECEVAVDVAGGEVTGRLRLGPLVVRLEDLTAVYTRLMDDRVLPEVRRLPAGAPERARCRAFHDTVTRWLELTPARGSETPPLSSTSSSIPTSPNAVFS